MSVLPEHRLVWQDLQGCITFNFFKSQEFVTGYWGYHAQRRSLQYCLQVDHLDAES